MAAPYAFRLALKSILNDRWINLLSTLTIASGIFIAALIGLSVYNFDLATGKLPEKFSVMLYLKDNLSKDEKDNIMDTLRREESIERVYYIPKDEALKELKALFKDAPYVVEGLGENPLYDSIEIKLKKEAVGPEIVRRLADKVGKMAGVAEIGYGEKFLSTIYSIKMGMRAIGFVFVSIMAAAMVFVCYSTVKILFYRKKEEIETYKLIGATRGFIRAPFIIEGAAIGLSGGLLSLIGVFSLYYMFFERLSLAIPLFKFIIFPVAAFLVLPLAGLVLGMAGAAIAIGRIRY
ncbi:MAG: ABC transporter permease [Nitrospira sp.]|nr:ABC transporter permease [Nitrospira sp.]